MLVGEKTHAPDLQMVERVHRAQAGDSEAFAELFQQLHPAILNYAHHILGDRPAAEDITQEAFLVAHQRLDQLGPPWDFKSWVYRIAGNLAIDHIRRERRFVDLEDPDMTGDPPTTRRPPERRVRQHEQERLIRQSLDQLPTVYRQALVLREILELSYEEVAKSLDCSSQNARQLVHRARMRFRDAFGMRAALADGTPVCGQLGELLSDYHDGLLSPEAVKAASTHMASCQQCRQTQTDLRKIGAMLAGLPPLLPMPTWSTDLLQRLQNAGPPGQGAAKVRAKLAEPRAGEASPARTESGIEPSPAPKMPASLPGLIGSSATARALAIIAFTGAGLLGALEVVWFGARGLRYLAGTSGPSPVATPTFAIALADIIQPASTGPVTEVPIETTAPSALILPGATSSPTPTTSPGPASGVATQNANCRSGPSTIYDNRATLLQDQSTPLEGRNEDSTWWWIPTPGGTGHCWVWGGALAVSGLLDSVAVVAAPPTPTPVPEDVTAPTVSISFAPPGAGHPSVRDKIAFTAIADDDRGVSRMEIWVRAPGQGQAVLAKTCLATTKCLYATGPYPPGKGECYAKAWDEAGNRGQSATVAFTVAP